MRKALIAVIVASALFAVGAFAASFAVNAEDVASGADDVAACAANVDVDFDDPTWDGALTAPDGGTGDWKTAGTTIRFYDASATPALTSACNGFDLTLRVETTGGPITKEVSDLVVTAGAADVNFDAPLQVSHINRVSVLVDDEEFTLAS
jgi:hypothetical protein